MCKQLSYLISFALALGLFLAGTAGAADPNLVGWWSFDGDFLDSSGNGRDGVLSGTGDFIEGVFGQALDQAGAAYVGITGYKGVLGTHAFSISAWIRTTDDQGVIVGWGGPRGAGDNGTFAEFRTANSGLLRVDHGGGDVRTNNFVNDDQWHHVAVTVAENASVQWPDVKLYIDGVEDGDHTGDADPFDIVSDNDVTIGREQTRDGRNFVGDIDEVRIYDRELSAEEIEKLSRPPQASKPTPADEGIHDKISLFLEWTPGFFAADENGHNLYFGDNFIDVNVGTPDTFKGTLSEDLYLIGGLVYGTTYYWRIDEVNEATVWKGNVWSFTIPDVKAWRPSPYDGARFMDPNVTLSWESGLDTIASYVYFGTDATEVAEGTGDTDKGQQSATTFTPGSLEYDTVYYWRIDEFKEDTTTEKGDVWSFRTRPVITITDPNLIGWWMLDEGAGTIVVDWSGHENHGVVMGDSQWVEGYDGGAVSFDGRGDYVAIENLYYSDVNLPAVSVCAWIRTSTSNGAIASFDLSEYWRLEVGGTSGDDGEVGWGVTTFSEGAELEVNLASRTHVDDGQWHHVAGVFGNSKLSIYIDGRLENYATGGDTFGTGTTRFGFIGTQSEASEFDGGQGSGATPFTGDIDNIRIYDRALTQEEIAESMRGDPRVAWNPQPGGNSTPNIEEIKPLSWSPGDEAVKHDIYFGTDQDAVENADASDTTDTYRGQQNLGNETYTPTDALEYDETYHWRIDEHNADQSLSRGRVWSFTVANFIVVEDIESYNSANNPIWAGWLEGIGYDVPPPPYGGNGTGSAVGDVDTASYTEESIVHGGAQSMPYEYNNSGSTGKLNYSEATLTLTSARDWTKQGVKALSLWFRGYLETFSTFTEEPPGTYTMTVRSDNVWGQSDEFHYVFKQLTGPGTIVAKVESVTNTSISAQAGVMIRETLEPDSKNAFAFMRADGGVRFNRRVDLAGDTINSVENGLDFPHWVKLERDMSGLFTVSHSTDGSTWVSVDDTDMGSSHTIQMNTVVYIGLALSSNNTGQTCEAVFSNVSTTGNIAGIWQSQDVGIISNNPEPMYLAVANSGSQPVVIYHEDPNATLIDTWTEWNIDLKEFVDEGLNLNDVDSIAIGFGNRDIPQAGGLGKMYFDDIRLYRPRCVAEFVKPVADFSNNCIVDMADVEIMANNWLISDYDVTVLAVSDANLEAHYEFDGNLLDSSGNLYHGDPCGTIAYTAGNIGQALDLDGTNYVNITGYKGVAGAESRTMSAWIKTATSGEIISWGQNTNSLKWIFRVQNEEADFTDGAIRIEVNGGSIVGETDLRDDQWHHVAAVLENDGSPAVGEIQLYVDGLLEVTTSLIDISINTASDSDVRIGKAPWVDRPFTGQIDDVRIYGRTLSHGELANLAGLPVGGTLRQPLQALLSTVEEVDLHDDEKIDFKDFAVLADSWLDELLWP